MVTVDRYGDGLVVTVKNSMGLITASIYITKEGDTHADSWLRSEGWPPREAP